MLLLEPDRTSPAPFARAALRGGEKAQDEDWLQDILFRHPDLIPLDRIEYGAGSVAPLAREFALPRPGGAVFLDLLGVTRSGRLVLIECKLWRNPQARREVVAQILEYAALPRGWSYADLTARLKTTTGMTGLNPIFAGASERFRDLDEAAFVDGVSRSLQSGDFHLIIAGDGIRSDLQAIAAHLNAGAQGPSRLSLVEFQLWRDANGRMAVIPNVALRTEVIEQRIIIGADGTALRLAPTDEADAEEQTLEERIDPARNDQRDRNRAFWQALIDQIQFDHPDQPPPRHGGNNWVRLDLPQPVGGLTLFRTAAGEAGFFLTFQGEEGAALYDTLSAEADALRHESGLPLRFEIEKAARHQPMIIATRPADPTLTEASSSEAAQRVWLINAANHIVTMLRPRIAAWKGEGA